MDIKRTEIEREYDWLFVQEYVGHENQATEALLKWFCFSSPAVQRQFLRRICGLRRVTRHRQIWDEMYLQTKEKRGVPDAKVVLRDKYVLVVESKVNTRSIGRKQVKQHLRDVGVGRRRTPRDRKIILKELVVTPDWSKPESLEKLDTPFREALVWTNWQRLRYFLRSEVRPRNSADRILLYALIQFLEKHKKIEKYLQ